MLNISIKPQNGIKKNSLAFENFDINYDRYYIPFIFFELKLLFMVEHKNYLRNMMRKKTENNGKSFAGEYNING